MPAITKSRTYWRDRLFAVLKGNDCPASVIMPAAELAARVDNSRPPLWWREKAAEVAVGIELAYDYGERIPPVVAAFLRALGTLADSAEQQQLDAPPDAGGHARRAQGL